MEERGRKRNIEEETDTGLRDKDLVIPGGRVWVVPATQALCLTPQLKAPARSLVIRRQLAHQRSEWREDGRFLEQRVVSGRRLVSGRQTAAAVMSLTYY